MRKLFAVVLTGCFLALMIAGSAFAQVPGTSIRASIPFEFVVQGRTLPAGNYEITRITDEPVGLLIRNVDHRRFEAMFSTEPLDARKVPNKSWLVFHRYGDTSFLSEVVTAGQQRGEELYPSHQERTLQKDMAKNNIQAETVTVAMN